MLSHYPMTTPANPKLLYPRQWNQFLGMKKAHMDEMSLEDFLAHWQVSRQDLATIWLNRDCKSLVQ